MEKNKQTNPATKKKVDASGLTKKERRALKVQEKGKQNPENKKDDKKEVPKAQPPKNTEKPVVTTNQLSEKELRKLEWEKKLAEQKAESGDKKEALSKAELRAKRREQQEAQRSAKTNVTTTKQKEQKEEKKPQKKAAEVKKTPVTKKPEKKKHLVRRLEFVNHLYSDATFGNTIVNFKNVHPAFVKLGVQYSSKRILGSNARCRALLTAVKVLIKDIQTPPKQEFCRYFETVLQSCMEHLNRCRCSAVSMNNALTNFKTELRRLSKSEEPDNQKKENLLEVIDTYIDHQMDRAGEAISMKVNEKINNGDVVLTYGCSSLIKKILSDAHSKGKQFQVIVVDGRPFLEGRQMLQRLVQIGINCSYVQMNALCYVMSLVTKVLLGAHALLTNGYVMSRIGTAQVALVAQAYNKPVLVCCETYKFSEQVLTDSFVYNELDDSEKLICVDTLEESSPLALCRNNDNLHILNMLYDVTPPDLITAVVTELAILPCTSAPVVLRLKPQAF
ncbi:translation initiation factor eIF2B subunit delta isoform X2 [Zophobas morio]|uniref:translation initiation factor eIF2B subunit delta isoform X2 n=1 Tax=Zophobas morio TaxID=2755281 RepID=UPI003083871C